MTLSEAARQYQAYLEAERRLLAAVGESTSFERERAAARRDVRAQYVILEDLHRDHVVAQMEKALAA